MTETDAPARTRHIGRRMARFEDQRFITGAGRYTDDIVHETQAVAVMVRSPYAHADIAGIDAEAAHAMPGVLGVFTGVDLDAAGVEPITSFTRAPPYQHFNSDGSEMPEAAQPPLARSRVRYAGEPVAMVVAETLNQARDGADAVMVDYNERPAVATIEAALADDAPKLWDELDDNRSFHWQTGDKDATDRLFEQAAHVTEIDVAFPRRIIAFMEPRAFIAHYDRERDAFLFEVGCQCAHWMRDGMALALDHDPDRIRVVVPDTGGGFGARSLVYPEFVAAAHAARALGRPVKWTSERSEGFMTDVHARSQQVKAAMALDQDGNFLAVRFSCIWHQGGYLASRSIFVLVSAMPAMICGPYAISAQHYEVGGVFTNTTPIGSYRGVGRSEAGYVLERLVDAAARETGRDPDALRRQNLIAPDAMPYASAAGLTYERCDFAGSFDMALERIDAAGFAERRQDAERRGVLRGLAVSPFIQTAGGVPTEFAEIALAADGAPTVRLGTQDFGMGHETTFAQIVADLIGVEPEDVRVIFGDTAEVEYGQGGHGSRSIRIGGGAVHGAAQTLIDAARERAADRLEAALGDIDFDAGRFTVTGTDRSVALSDLAAEAADAGRPLSAKDTHTVDGPGLPHGAHGCEVEITPETGHIRLVRVVTVIDPGTVINPTLLEGQMHGGVVQGLGEALHERVVFDGETGQLLSGSFMDFTLPRADDVPMIETVLDADASPASPLGVKGVGEIGTMVVQAVVVNAVLDALKDYGISHLDMPVTAESVWLAIRQAQSV